MPLPKPAAQVMRGFAMGSADIVPGVSGGTVALVLGIYERLIANVHAGAHVLREVATGNLAKAPAAVRKVEWVWLLSLLAGILLAVVSLASAIETLLDEQPVRMAALFFGLVAGSVIVAFRLIKVITPAAVLLMFAVAATMFALLGLRSETSSDAAEIVTEPLWIFFLSGALAICAMILPGISGSFILVMIGMYGEVLGAVNDRDYGALAATAAGCVAGLALFSTLLNWLLAHHHDLVIAAMIGLMLGSLRVLWPWPGGVDTTELGAPRGDLAVPVLLMGVGFVVVLGVELLAQRLTSSATREMPSTRSSSPSANENLA